MTSVLDLHNTLNIILPDDLYDSVPIKSCCIDTDNEEEDNQESFKQLLTDVYDHVELVEKIIQTNFEYFRPFVRNEDINVIISVLSDIMNDIKKLQTLNLKTCRYNKECNRKECCAYVHHLDFENLTRPLKFLQDNMYRFIEKKYFSFSSAIIRNIHFIHTATWNSLSRRKFGLLQVNNS